MSIHTKLKDYALVAVPPPPPKFSLSEWRLNNNYRSRVCLDQQRLADSIIAETDRSIDGIKERTEGNKKEADQKLAERIFDIDFIKSEIEKQRKEVCLEIDNLNTYMERIRDCTRALKDALKLCQKCVVLREGRLGIELCYDNVEKGLKKELHVIEGAQSLLNRTLEQANEQVRRLRSIVYFIDRDLEDKGIVLQIDQDNKELKETSLNLSIYHGLASLDPASITLEEWEQNSRNNIENAAKEINSARQLRCYVDIILKQAIEDLWNQYHSVNEAFRQRMEETKNVKTKMEVQHSEVVRQCNEMTRAITRLEKSIAEKEGYTALAHTRLGKRAQRPGVELCKDQVSIALTTEVGELRDNVAVLQHKLAEAQASLRYLLKTQIQLEEDLNVKVSTLKIDEVDCMTLRQSMDYHAY